MAKIHIAFTICLLFATSTFASSNFFTPCKDAFKMKQFKPLKEAFKDHVPESCFRLNDKEFLATVVDVARTAQGLFYFNVTDGKIVSSCGDSCFQAGIRVEREFTGPNAKRFVLLKSSDLSRGLGFEQYEILNLVPKKGSQRPFIKYELVSAHSSTWGDSMERCTEDFGIDEDVDIKSYSIKDEGTAKLKLIFRIEGQNCKTKAKLAYDKTFTLIDGVFKASGVK